MLSTADAVEAAIVELTSKLDLSLSSDERRKLAAELLRQVIEYQAPDGFAYEGGGPPGTIGMMRRVPKYRRAYSIKLQNVFIDPLASTKTAFGAVKDSVVVAGGAAAIGTFSSGLAAGIGAALSPLIAIGSLLLAGHYFRRIDVKYEHACILHHAWAVSDPVDFRRQFYVSQLIEADSSVWAAYNIGKMTPADIQDGIQKLEILGAIQNKTSHHELLEAVV